MEGMLAKVDRKGRVAIPSKIRKTLGIKNFVKIKVEDGRVVLEPAEDPLGSLRRIVVKGTKDIEEEVRELRLTAEHQLLKEVKGN